MRIEVVSDRLVGDGGFLAVRRVELVNVRDDGTRSAPYICDFVARPKGVDAVVVAVWARVGGAVQVLLRDGMRAALVLGRPHEPRALFFREVVAGIVENDDWADADGLRKRAAIEVEEEAGLRVRFEDVRLLGAGTFPSPGAMPEKFWLAAVEVPDATIGVGQGDGSPMEEGATVRWMPLDDAIAACVRGELEDAKTELVLRRLREAVT